ncbi:hypothetical protein ACLOJK_000091 [Asimina triloba]
MAATVAGRPDLKEIRADFGAYKKSSRKRPLYKKKIIAWLRGQARDMHACLPAREERAATEAGICMFWRTCNARGNPTLRVRATFQKATVTEWKTANDLDRRNAVCLLAAETQYCYCPFPSQIWTFRKLDSASLIDTFFSVPCNFSKLAEDEDVANDRSNLLGRTLLSWGCRGRGVESVLQKEEKQLPWKKKQLSWFGGRPWGKKYDLNLVLKSTALTDNFRRLCNVLGVSPSQREEAC